MNTGPHNPDSSDEPDATNDSGATDRPDAANDSEVAETTPPNTAHVDKSPGEASKNDSYISIIALVIAVFFLSFYLRGERERKAKIERELDLIRTRQAEIMESVQQLNTDLTQKDSVFLKQIEQADSFISQLNNIDSLGDTEVDSITAMIQRVKDAFHNDVEAPQSQQDIPDLNASAAEETPSNQ